MNEAEVATIYKNKRERIYPILFFSKMRTVKWLNDDNKMK